MKTTVWAIGIILFFAASAKAQLSLTSTIPEAAKTAFHKQYPKANHVIWTMDKDGLVYQARFESHHKAFIAIYDRQGKSLGEVVEINKIKLPHRARRQLRDNYTSFAIEHAIMIKSTDGEVIYETFISRAEEAYELMFNTSGYLLSVTPTMDYQTEE